MLGGTAPLKEERRERRAVAVPSRRPDPSLIAIAAGFAVLIAYAAWLLSPRFGIPSPSSIDDWNGASEPNSSIGRLLAPFFDAPEIRFRPGYDLFDHIQWHTLGAPDMTGPNIWNIVRAGLLLAAVSLLPALLARAVRPTLSAPALGLLAAVPGAIAITGSAIVIDFARLAPQEPMLVGASICGAALVLLALDRLLRGTGAAGVLIPALLGWPLFVLGIFHKEAGVAYLLLAPFVYLFLSRRWREAGLFRHWVDPLRDPRVLLFAAALLLPLLWQTYQVVRIGGEGANLYGAGAPTGISGWIDRLRAAFRSQWNSMTLITGSALWRGLVLAVPFLAVAVWADRRRAPWLPIGFGLAGMAMLVMQGLTGVVVSRYFIPTMALLAIAAVLLIAESRAWLRWAALTAALIVVANGAGPARDAVAGWSADEEATSSFVEQTADLAERGCRLQVTGLDQERADALPRLVGLQMDTLPDGPCPVRAEALTATLWASAPADGGYSGYWAICDGRWTRVFSAGLWVMMRCERLAQRAEGQDTETHLRDTALVPGVGPGPYGDCLKARDDASCQRPRLDRSEPWP